MSRFNASSKRRAVALKPVFNKVHMQYKVRKDETEAWDMGIVQSRIGVVSSHGVVARPAVLLVGIASSVLPEWITTKRSERSNPSE